MPTFSNQPNFQLNASRRTPLSGLDALAAKHGDLIFTCHGGAIETPEDFAAFLVKEPRLHGYVGGSSAERFPIEESVPKATRGFKAVPLPKTG
jgi:predicted TIM-barrel enzyme